MITFFVLLVSVVCLFYKYSTQTFGRFTKCGIPHRKPFPLIGNLLDVFLQRTSYQEALESIYREFGDARVCGFFNLRLPTLMLRDLDLINTVFKTESSKVVDRGLFADESDPLSMNLFFMTGPLWKTSREKLRPAFKSKNMKNLIPSFQLVGSNLISDLKAADGASVNVKDHTSRFSANIITSSFLGLDLTSRELDIFIEHTSKLFYIEGFRAFPVLFRMFLPEVATRLGVRVAPSATEAAFLGLIQDMKSKCDHFSQYIFKLREHFEKEGKSQEFLDGIVVGQFFVFILAGFETTSSTLSFALYFLAQNPEIHRRMRREVELVLAHNEGKIDFEALKEMKLVNNVISETLRMYPPVSGMVRVVSSELDIPGANITLQPGEAVTVCITGLHKDELYYKDPDTFNPDRFLEPIPEGAFIPFGHGPRICIGKDLALLELKTALSLIALNFDLELDTQRMPEKLEIDPSNLFTTTKSGIWLKFKTVK